MRLPDALSRLAVPEMSTEIGMSLRDAERDLAAVPAPGGLLDATAADTHRFPPPDWALPAFTEAASGAGATYTPYRGDAGVREALHRNIPTVLGVPVASPANVILTPGTQGALFIAIASIIEPGDLVLLPDPDYMSTARILRYFGARVRRIPIVWPETGRPALDLDAFDEALGDDPRLMIFSHPNNPSGVIYGEETIAAIAERARRHDLTVIADELYSRLVYDGEPFFHLAAQDGMAERTVTLLGPSKTESLSGYRLGVAVGPDELVDRMDDVQACTALRAPSYAQHLLSHWLAEDAEYVAQRIKEYTVLRDTTVATLNASGIFQVRPSFGTAYVFPRLLTGADDHEVAKRLKAAGVLVNPGYHFGPSGHGHMRLCFAHEEAKWEAALNRMIEVLS